MGCRISYTNYCTIPRPPQINGTITQSINQLQNTGSPDASQLADLIQQLQTLINDPSELSETTKTETLEQTQELATAAQDSQQPHHQKLAKTAIHAIKGILSILSPTNLLIDQVTQILDKIGNLIIR